MRYILNFIAALAVCAHAAAAQELTALARVDPAQSRIEDGWFGGTTLTVALSQGVPFRVFMLDDPARLIVDFREADWSGVTPEALLPEPGRIGAVRFGAFQPGWSRLVADLVEPMVPQEIGMPVDTASGTARLEITLKKVTAEQFATRAGASVDPSWTTALTRPPTDANPEDSRFVVVIDPGHGGIDPGAEVDGLQEKDLMLIVARSLQEALRRNGAEAVLTRDEDHFISLEGRVARAHQESADLFVSLHADILTQGGASGATVYTLSDEASDAATAHLAARHNRSDIIAGADLTGSDDQVAGVLLDLARQETSPRSSALAGVLVATMEAAGAPMNRHPLRRAGFSVLKSADIPSVLIELGFLSSNRDLTNLRDPVWRAEMVAAITQGILAWRDKDATSKPLTWK